MYHGIPVSLDLVAVQPGNKHLTTESFDGKVAIYSIENWNLERIAARSSANNQPGEEKVESLSPNGLYYAFTENRMHKIRLLDISSSAAPEVPLEGNCSDVLQLSFDPRSEFLACANKSGVIIWSTKNRTKNSTIKLPSGYTIKKAALSPEGRYIATTSTNGETRLWDTHDSHDNAGVILPFGDAQSVSFSRDGRWLSVGSQSEIKLWDLNAKKLDPRRIPVGGLAMKFSPDDSLLATSEDENGKISAWELDPHNPLLAGTTSHEKYEGGDFAFISNSDLLTADRSGVLVKPFDAKRTLKRVCHIVNRDLTPEEWNKYLPGSKYTGSKYTPICKQMGLL